MTKTSCKLKLITHACATISDNKSKLIFDPWFFGTAFNKGWKLPQEIDISRTWLETITHTCITHEHPDHFHIPTLKRINDMWNPIFLIQATSDRRMANFINKVLGKEVIELKDGERYDLSSSIAIKIYSHGHMDSFVLVKAEDTYILNINDCVLKTQKSLERLKNRLKAKRIDVLMSQYSFASYSGNIDDTVNLKGAAEQHLTWIRQRNDFFQPKVFIPFASGIEWCASENKYLNKYRVKTSDVENTLKKSKIPPAIFKPHTNETIIYKKLLISSKDVRISKGAGERNKEKEIGASSNDYKLFDRIEEIACAALKELDQLNNKMASKLLKALGAISVLEEVLVEARLETGRIEYLELLPGLRIKHLKESDNRLKYRNHISMSMDSLAYCFLNQYGAETLWVNSRFRIIKGKPKTFFKHFYLSILANQGFYFPIGYIRFAWTRILKPVLSK